MINRANRQSIHRFRLSAVAILMLMTSLATQVFAIEPSQLDAAISKAVASLAVEVPKWRIENTCASCHNQGDAARALIEAHRQGFIDTTQPLESTLQWLSTPNSWKDNYGAQEFNDPVLSNVQFANSLLVARLHWGERFSRALEEAAALIAKLQKSDGSWEIDGGATFASPITHGSILLTGTSVRILDSANRQTYNQPIERGEQWLARQQARNIVEASSLLIATDQHPNFDAQRSECVKILVDAQGTDGGLGPHANAQAEVFDTALALLALAKTERNEKVQLAIENCARYLLKQQEESGMWPGTVRPSGIDS